MTNHATAIKNAERKNRRIEKARKQLEELSAESYRLQKSDEKRQPGLVRGQQDIIVAMAEVLGGSWWAGKIHWRA